MTRGRPFTQLRGHGAALAVLTAGAPAVGAAVGRVLLGPGAGVDASLGAGRAVATGWPAPTESRTTSMADQEIPTANAAAHEPSTDGEQPHTHLSMVAARPDSCAKSPLKGCCIRPSVEPRP